MQHVHRFAWSVPGGSHHKESFCNVGDLGLSLDEKMSWRRKQLPTPVFLPGESREQRSLVGCSPPCCRVRMTERLLLSLSGESYYHCECVLLKATCQAKVADLGPESSNSGSSPSSDGQGSLLVAHGILVP